MTQIDEKVHVSSLLDAYGALLTERQRDFIDLYYNEDLSFGEIAESEHISRQAVHDAIQHGIKALEHFERHLALVYQRRELASSHITGQNGLKGLKQELEEIYRILKSDDILYDTQPLRRKVRALIERVNE